MNLTITISDAEIKTLAQLIAVQLAAIQQPPATSAPTAAPTAAPTPAPTAAPVVRPPAQVTKAEPATGVRVVQAIKELRVNSGEYAGMYILAPAGYGNWYFADFGLESIIPYLNTADLDYMIKAHLDLYLRKLRSDYTIDDVEFPGGIAFPTTYTLRVSDSDDSYASTKMSLARAYVVASGNWSWWTANKSKFIAAMDANTVKSIKVNNLTSTFQPTNIQKTYEVGYFMDNCEVYRGLTDLAYMLRIDGSTTQAAYFQAAADRVATGLRSLWATTGFRYADAALTLRTTDKAFYPDGACQAFAQVFGVKELADLYTPAYNYLNTNFAGWEKGTLDPFPFAVVGYCAALRGDGVRARAQMTSIESKFQLQRPVVTINELGWYAKTRQLLSP